MPVEHMIKRMALMMESIILYIKSEVWHFFISVQVSAHLSFIRLKDSPTFNLSHWLSQTLTCQSAQTNRFNSITIYTIFWHTCKANYQNICETEFQHVLLVTESALDLCYICDALVLRLQGWWSGQRTWKLRSTAPFPSNTTHMWRTWSPSWSVSINHSSSLYSTFAFQLYYTTL